eukprot:3102782-Alexandrium_andersonii.AAC.2
MRGLSTRLHRKPGGTPPRASPRRARWSWAPRCLARWGRWRPSLRSSGAMKGPHGESVRPGWSARSSGSKRGPVAQATCDGVRVACRGRGAPE